MGEDRDAPDGAAEIERLEREFANLMARLDRAKGLGTDVEVSRAHENAEIDPMLERDLQLVLAAYLSGRGQPGTAGSSAELAAESALAQLGEGAVDEALQARVKPLFEALLSTALGHTKAASEAIAAGRDPSTRKVAELTVDLSDLLEDDS